jgi:hypothetical protein
LADSTEQLQRATQLKLTRGSQVGLQHCVVDTNQTQWPVPLSTRSTAIAVSMTNHLGRSEATEASNRQQVP